MLLMIIKNFLKAWAEILVIILCRKIYIAVFTKLKFDLLLLFLMKELDQGVKEKQPKSASVHESSIQDC